jgi:6-phosphogluconolactonase
MTAATNEFWMYVGTYTRLGGQAGEKSLGIYTYRFNQVTGAIVPVGSPTEIANPSFLAFSPDGDYLYSVNELTEVQAGRPAGAVSAFRVDRATGALTYLNQIPTKGTSPCHLVVDATGKWVLVTNYSSGTVCVLGVGEGGALGAMSEFIQHTGSSVNPQRQGEPHPHSINLDPANRFAFVPDLGTDKVMIYAFDAENGKLTPDPEQPWARARSGVGPRHLAFHPNGRFVFVANELISSLTVYALDATKGTLREVETVSSLPEDFEGKSWCADIHVHPNGKTVYISNRGHDSIGVFAIDEADGKLKALEYVSTQGEFPRNFAISPNGEYLLAANQNTGDIFTYRVDTKSGRLTPTGERLKVPAPVCIKFLSIE